MTTRATGPFVVTLTPQPFEGAPEGAKLGRLTLDKQFSGDLEATSKGQMLSAGTDVEGPRGTGHRASDRHAARPQRHVRPAAQRDDGARHAGLVGHRRPDSGTGQLAGIEGSMAIVIANGKHSYEFDYTLPS